MPWTAGRPHLNGGAGVLDLIVAEPGARRPNATSRDLGVAYGTVRRAASEYGASGLVMPATVRIACRCRVAAAITIAQRRGA